MNDAMPQWRTFSSDAPGRPAPAPRSADAPANDRSRDRDGWIVAGLVGLGGATLGAVLVVVAMVALEAAPTDSLLGPVGEPLAGWPGSPGQDLPAADGRAAAVATVDEEIFVDVAGAVSRPGLHRLRAGDRVGDAIEAAGGFAPRVDVAEASRSLNLAEPLVDGSKVLVPELGVAVASHTSPDDGRIDVNAADQAALESLPGIGPVTAGKIIAARAERRFEEVGDLRTRSLVGASVFEQIRDLVRVGR